jgi:hypothetical protein
MIPLKSVAQIRGSAISLWIHCLGSDSHHGYLIMKHGLLHVRHVAEQYQIVDETFTRQKWTRIELQHNPQ